MTKVVWLLTGGPCAGQYEAESSWPPPQRIRAVHGGGLLCDEPPAVLDLPEDEPDPGEKVVEYELVAHGFVCMRGGKGSKSHNPLTASYVRAGLAPEAQAKEFRRAGAGIEGVVS